MPKRAIGLMWMYKKEKIYKKIKKEERKFKFTRVMFKTYFYYKKTEKKRKTNTELLSNVLKEAPAIASENLRFNKAREGRGGRGSGTNVAI